MDSCLLILLFHFLLSKIRGRVLSLDNEWQESQLSAFKLNELNEGVWLLQLPFYCFAYIHNRRQKQGGSGFLCMLKEESSKRDVWGPLVVWLFEGQTIFTKPFIDSKTVPLTLQRSAHVSRHFSLCPKKRVIPDLLVDARWDDKRWLLALPVTCPEGVRCGELVVGCFWDWYWLHWTTRGCSSVWKFDFCILKLHFQLEWFGGYVPSKNQWLLEQRLSTVVKAAFKNLTLNILVFAPGFGKVSNVLSLWRDFSFCSVMDVFISALIDMEIWESHLLVIHDQYTTFTYSMLCCFLPKMEEAEMMNNHRMTGLEKPLENKRLLSFLWGNKREEERVVCIAIQYLWWVAISKSRHGKLKSVYYQVNRSMYAGWNYHQWRLTLGWFIGDQEG